MARAETGPGRSLQRARRLRVSFCRTALDGL